MLVEYGMAGIFIAYMIWQDRYNSKKAEAQLVKFENQIDKMREKRSSDQQALRDRYDAVIKKYDDERKTFHQDKDDMKLKFISLMRDYGDEAEKVNDNLKHLTEIIKSQNFLLEDQSREFSKSKEDMKDISTNVEEVLKLLKDMISDQKIRDAASAAAKTQFSSIIQSKD